MATLKDMNHLGKSISELDIAKEVTNSDLLLITQQTSSGTNRSKAVSVRDFLATALTDYNDIKEWVESRLSRDGDGEDGTGGGSGQDGDGDDDGSSGNGGNSIWNGTAVNDSALSCNVSSIEDDSGRKVRIGDLYLNSSNQCIYACISVNDGVSRWNLVTSIKGAAGATGSTGSQGPQGPQGPAGSSISWNDISSDVQSVVTTWLAANYGGGGSSGGSGSGQITIVGSDHNNSAEVTCLTIGSLDNANISAYVDDIDTTNKTATLRLGAYYK